MSAKPEIPIAGRLRPYLIKAIAEMEQASGFSWQKGNPVSALLNAESMTVPTQARQVQPLPQRYKEVGSHSTYTRLPAGIAQNSAVLSRFPI